MKTGLSSAPKRIWVTGATSGIGRSLVKEMIAAHHHLIVTARSRSQLEELRQMAPGQIEILPADISNPDCVGEITTRLHELTGYLDAVILNAGTCEYLDLDNFDSSMFERVIQVNFLGMVRCVESSLKLLKQSSSPAQIVGISSAAALTGLPRAEAYGASKAAVDSFLESLALDLQPHSIDVSIVHPGFVDTPLTRKNDFPMPFLMGSDQAAKLIYKGMVSRNKNIAFPRKLIWPLRLLSNLPAVIRNRILRSVVRKPAQQI